jgi:hypothetical protein
MHIDRANQVPVPGELAGTAHPISSLGLVVVPTCRTAARCSSFGAGEAHDVGRLRFVGQVVDVLAIFPHGHALIVIASMVLVTDPMRITDEESADLVLYAKIDNFAGRFMSEVTNTTVSTAALLSFGSLQLFPAPRILYAPGLLLRNFA